MQEVHLPASSITGNFLNPISGTYRAFQKNCIFAHCFKVFFVSAYKPYWFDASITIHRLHSKLNCLLKNDPPFLLQICPKLCYFIYEYACLLPERSAISEKKLLWWLALELRSTYWDLVRTSFLQFYMTNFNNLWRGRLWSGRLWSGAPTGPRVFG